MIELLWDIKQMNEYMTLRGERGCEGEKGNQERVRSCVISNSLLPPSSGLPSRRTFNPQTTMSSSQLSPPPKPTTTSPYARPSTPIPPNSPGSPLRSLASFPKIHPSSFKSSTAPETPFSSPTSKAGGDLPSLRNRVALGDSMMGSPSRSEDEEKNDDGEREEGTGTGSQERTEEGAGFDTLKSDYDFFFAAAAADGDGEGGQEMGSERRERKRGGGQGGRGGRGRRVDSELVLLVRSLRRAGSCRADCVLGFPPSRAWKGLCTKVSRS